MNRIRVFISSPGDGLRERQIAERVINRLEFEKRGISHPGFQAVRDLYGKQ